VNRENRDPLRRLLKTGEVGVVIDKTYPLVQAAKAVRHMLEHHASGKSTIAAQRRGTKKAIRIHVSTASRSRGSTS
jgi:hypothetical protein